VGAIRDGWQGTPRIERWDGRGRWGAKEEDSDGGRGGGRRDMGHDFVEGEVGDRDAVQVHEGVVSGEVHGWSGNRSTNRPGNMPNGQRE